jgi:LacI family transcriptional regulator
MANMTTRNVGLREIAEAAGVSISTVSMSLADHPDIRAETKQRIREISREMGYRKARRTSRHGTPNGGNGNTTYRFGFLLMGSRIEDTAKLSLLRALTLAATKLSSRMEVQAIEDVSDPRRLTDEIIRFASNLDGVVVSDMVDMTVLQGLESADVPHIILGHLMAELYEVSGQRGQIVTADDEGMGRLATTTLLAAGHRRIAFACERIPKGLWAANWLRGYRGALVETELPVAPELLYVAGKPFADTAPGAEVLLSLKHPPTAYIVPDARFAASLLESLKARGVTPDPQSVVVSGHEPEVERYGLSNYPWIGYDLNQVAAVAVRQLQQLCVGPMPCLCQLTVPLSSRNLPARKS